MDAKRLYEILRNNLKSERILISFGDDDQLYDIEDSVFIFTNEHYTKPQMIQKAPIILKAIPLDKGKSSDMEVDQGDQWAETGPEQKGPNGSNYMENLKNYFKEAIGIPLDDFLPREELYPLDGDEQSAFLFGSAVAKEKGALLIQADIDSILNADTGYFLIGFWGHGINSYAFYYVRADCRSRIFFRLPYGGVYMDNEKCAAYIVEFMTGFLAFEKVIAKSAREFVAINSMSENYYKIVTTDGRTFECSFPFDNNSKNLKRIFNYPVIEMPKNGDRAQKLSKKLEEYRQRLINGNPNNCNNSAKDTLYKISLLERLIKEGRVSTHRLAQEVREKHKDLDSEIFENAGLVIDDYMRTGGISVKGGTGLR